MNDSKKKLEDILKQKIQELSIEKEFKVREPVDALVGVKFSDGHIHIHYPDSKEYVQEFVATISSKDIGIKPIQNKELDRKPIIFKNRQAFGDILMFTCAIRDIKNAYPKLKIGVSSTLMHLWDYNPYIDRSLTLDNAEVIEIGPGWLTNASNRDDRHFANAFRISMEQKLGITIPQGAIRPDIWMSEEEINAPPIITPPYWIIVAGEKGDWTAKTYPFPRWQKFIERHPNVTFVQIGAREHVHPPLSGNNVINLIGKTQDKNTGVRDLLKLFYHAEGSIGLVSFQMHLAAAFDMPCIVIAGAREPERFTRYPGHQYLCTDGCLPCSISKACWHCKLEVTCKHIVEINGRKYPKCVEIINTDDLDRAFMQLYYGGRLDFFNPRVPTLPNIPIVLANEEEKKKVIHPSAESKKDLEKQDSDFELAKKFGFDWSGASITFRDYKFLKEYVESYNIKTILEFGPGLSTVLFNNLSLDIVSYETVEQRKDSLLKQFPFLKIKIWDGKGNLDEIDKKNHFDLVFVDGPAGGINREFSTKIASEVGNIVVVHDAGREWEKKWQDKYLENKFEGPIKGGHRCHLWIRKDSIVKKKSKEDPLTIEFPKDKKTIQFLFNGRGEGGAERSTTWLMNEFHNRDWNVQYISPKGPSGYFRKFGNRDIHITDDLRALERPSDILLLYTNDWVWEFDTDSVKVPLEASRSHRKVMAVNFRIGKIGEIPWTKGWDKYIFLNSSIESFFTNQYMKSEGSSRFYTINSEVLPPPTDLSSFLVNPISSVCNSNINNRLVILRHSSQGDSKYDKNNFNILIKRIKEEIPGTVIHLMPAPSFLEDFGETVISHKRNIPPVEDFLTLGNCFWYHLPEGYEDQGPKVIMEAQASGLPIVAPNHSGAKSRIVHGVNGFLADNDDKHIEFLKILAINPKVRIDMGREARKHAVIEYHPDKWINAIIGEEKK